MFDIEEKTTHPDFRFLSRRTRDIISGVMLIVAGFGLAGLSGIVLIVFFRILWLLGV